MRHLAAQTLQTQTAQDIQFEKRIQLMERYTNFKVNVTRDEVMWWAALDEAPQDVLEFLEFLVSRFKDIWEPFTIIDGAGWACLGMNSWPSLCMQPDPAATCLVVAELQYCIDHVYVAGIARLRALALVHPLSLDVRERDRSVAAELVSICFRAFQGSVRHGEIIFLATALSQLPFACLRIFRSSRCRDMGSKANRHFSDVAPSSGPYTSLLLGDGPKSPCFFLRLPTFIASFSFL